MPCEKKMKQTLLLVLAAGILAVLCGCSSTEDPDKRSNGEEINLQHMVEIQYEPGDNRVSRTVTPNSSLTKQEIMYQYEDYRLYVAFSASTADSLKQKLEKEAGRLLSEKADSLKKTGEQADADIAGKPAVKQSYTWKATGLSGKDPVEPEQTGHVDVAGFETDMGAYVISVVCDSDESYKNVKTDYNRVLESVSLSDRAPQEIYTENVGQGGGFVFYLQGWTSRTENREGTVSYMDSNMNTLLIRPLKHVETDEAVMEETVKELCSQDPWYMSNPVTKVQVKSQKRVDTSAGSAIRTELELTAENQASEEPLKTDLSAVFVQDREKKAICCLMVSGDSEPDYDYSPILNSLRSFNELEDKTNRLWDKRAQYAGDAAEVSQLAEDTDLGGYGEYTLELDTEKEPYGLIIHYTKPVKDFDGLYLDGEAALLLGLIENLDYVEIKSGTDTKKLTCDQANGIMKYDIKTLGQEKAKLQSFIFKDAVTRQP